MLSVVNLQQLGAISTVLNECIEYTERNANPKILFLDGLIYLSRSPQPTTLTDSTSLSQNSVHVPVSRLENH